MKDISLKDLLEAGCHFGHQVNRWNPRAKSFIYSVRDGIHIIDLAKTKAALEEACNFIIDTAANGGSIIFVGTKRQARGIIKEEAQKAGAMYLVVRWLGGLLTNWTEIKKNLDKLKKMRDEKEKDQWNKFTKKEQLLKGKELDKLEGLYAGIADLTELPAALVLVDIRKEESAVSEALKTGVKTVAIVDTNTNPDLVDYPIPANDDATGSIKLIASYLADAYLEGKSEFEKKEEKVPARNASHSDAGGEQVEKTEEKGKIKTKKVKAQKSKVKTKTTTKKSNVALSS